MIPCQDYWHAFGSAQESLLPAPVIDGRGGAQTRQPRLLRPVAISPQWPHLLRPSPLDCLADKMTVLSGQVAFPDIDLPFRINCLEGILGYSPQRAPFRME